MIFFERFTRQLAGLPSVLLLGLLLGCTQQPAPRNGSVPAEPGDAAEEARAVPPTSANSGSNDISGEGVFHLENPYAFKRYQHKVQLHSHTNLSDGNHEPTWVMRAYEEIGYAAVAITDHDHMSWTPTLEDPGGHNIVHLSGVEYSGTRTQSWDHMLGIGIRTIHHGDGMRNRIAQTHQAHLEDGLIYLCHPYDAAFRHRRGWEREQVTNPAHPYDGMEVHNGGSYIEESPGGDFPYKVDAALMSGKEIHLIAVDDFHRNPQTTMDRGFVVINSDVSQADLTAHDVMEALRKGNFFAAGRTRTSFPVPPRFTDIRVENQKVLVSTDKPCTIDFINFENNYFTRYEMDRDPFVHRVSETTSAEYDAGPGDRWIRIKATFTDESGESYAWSNPIHVRGGSVK
jgi:hypothetical protein